VTTGRQSTVFRRIDRFQLDRTERTTQFLPRRRRGWHFSTPAAGGARRQRRQTVRARASQVPAPGQRGRLLSAIHSWQKARQVAFEMYEKLLSAGRFTFAPMITGSDQPVVPAATGAETEGNLLGLGFADLAVQAVGYERGGEDPKVHIYVTRGSAAKLKRLEQTYNGVTIQVNNVGDPTVRPRITLSVTRHGRVYDRNGRVAWGSSCAPAGAVYAGTFGAIVRKAGQPKLYMLSNNHVIGGCNHTVVGMPIMAPSTADSRPDIPAPISIGRHSEIVELRSGDPGLVHPCRADVALAEVVDDDRVTSWG